jgi:hypothetical protein
MVERDMGASASALTMMDYLKNIECTTEPASFLEERQDRFPAWRAIYYVHRTLDSVLQINKHSELLDVPWRLRG